MKFLGKLFGGLIGVFFPPFGVFLGIIIGHAFDAGSGRIRQEQQIPNQSFLSEIFYFYGLCSAVLGPTQRRDLLIKRQLGSISNNLFSTLEAYRSYVGGIQDEPEDPAVFLKGILMEYRVDPTTRIWITQVLVQLFEGSQNPLLRELQEVLGYAGAGQGQERGPARSQVRSSDYVILGLPQQTPLEQVKKKYRELAKAYHPDQWSGPDFTQAQQETARKKFIEIQHAYQRIKENLEGSPQ